MGHVKLNEGNVLSCLFKLLQLQRSSLTLNTSKMKCSHKAQAEWMVRFAWPKCSAVDTVEASASLGMSKAKFAPLHGQKEVLPLVWAKWSPRFGMSKGKCPPMTRIKWVLPLAWWSALKWRKWSEFSPLHEQREVPSNRSFICPLQSLDTRLTSFL